jgi:hypothetical protein
MRLGRSKSESERLIGTVTESLANVRGDVQRSTLVKAALIAGGVAALTAGSAAISSFRRRMETGS